MLTPPMQELSTPSVWGRSVEPFRSTELIESNTSVDVDRLVHAQNRALALIVSGAPLSEILDELVRTVEAGITEGGGLGSIFLLDPSGERLRHGSAPSLPDAYNAALDGIRIGREIGTCCAAAARNEIIFTPDINADPSWAAFKQLPLNLGLRAAWSMPIVSSTGKVLGTFGTYFRECRLPTEREQRLVAVLCKTAAIAIEKRNAETQRIQSEEQQHALYELVAAVNRADALPQIYAAALEAICRCQRADRASILLDDGDGVMRFKAWRNLSEEYRRAVEGHSPWRHDDPDPQPISIDDVAAIPLDRHLHEAIEREGICSLAFIPLRYEKRLLGKFMLYYDQPHHFTAEELRPVQTVASQVSLAIEREKAEAALESLVDERTRSLREAIAQMEEFSYSVSHDLRAPVRAIHGYANALIDDYRDQLDTHAHTYLERIVRSSERMDRLIQDILVYSRLSRREIQLEPVSLSKLISEIIFQYPEMQSPQAEIRVVEPLASVIAHEPSLSQAISNLLGNAVKFVPPGRVPQVRIWTETRDGGVRLWIEDNGIGIDPVHQSRLFGMFERIHGGTTYEGTGIGLAIVRKAAERMNGQTGVESDGHTGSRFWIQLPAA